MIGIALRNSAIATARETSVLQTLAAWPACLQDCSTVLAYLFSTVGCIALVSMLAMIDLRIIGSARVVCRDVVVSATPIVYVTGVKWLVERPRPITSVGSGLLPGDPSFPSGHTAAAVIVSVMLILTVRNLARKRFPDTGAASQGGDRCRGACRCRGMLAIAAWIALSDRCDDFSHDLPADFIRRVVRMAD